jgi:hypothetical protein
MSRPSKEPQKKSPGKTQESPSQNKSKKTKRNTIFTVVAISLVIALVAGIGYYLIYVMPFQRVIIKVDNEVVRIDYFLKRILTNPNGEDIWNTLEMVTNELIVKQEAPKYGITVTEQDIDTFLRDAAKGDSESITDAEFKEWYRQRLNASQLSEKLFRDLVARSLMQQRMAELLANQVPNTAEQGHFFLIVVPTYDEAVKIKERADNGEVFENLATEVSIDTQSKEKGGDIGWLPYGVIDPRFESIITALEIRQASDPVMYDQEAQNYVIFMISEKSVDMEVLPEHLNVLKAKAYKDWLNDQMAVKQIAFRGLSGGGFDSETHSYLSYQVQRLRRGISGTSEEETTDPGAQQP